MTTTARKPWLAAALSLVCPGLGHVYVGRLARGLWVFLLSLVVAPDAVAVALLPPSDATLALLAASSVAALLLAVFAVADSWRIARALPEDYAPREYQRPAVYAAFLVVGIVCPVVAAVVLRTQVFEAFRIASDSMAPALRRGDRVLANTMRFGASPARRGDIVVYRARDERGEERNFIKRLVGLPGDLVEVRQGRVIVNGEPLPLESAGGDAHAMRERSGGRSYRVLLGDGPGGDAPQVRLGSDQYYVLGDDRARSMDSRTTGPVARRDLIGPAEYLFLPADDWGRAGALGDDE